MNLLPYAISAGFVLVSAVYLGLVFLEFRRGLEKTSFDDAKKKRVLNRIVYSVIAWTLFVSIWSLRGKMSDFSIFPLNMMPVFAVPLIGILAFVFSKTVREILAAIPQQNLIRLQSFRIAVELLLWALYAQNLAPVQMTFEGRNLDILSGLSAPIIAWLVSRGKLSGTGILFWNIICLGLLANIVATAILSMPTPLRAFMNEPANTIVATFPISWLPGLLVPMAYGLHFLSLRQLAIQNGKLRMENGK